jgi:ribosomal protein S18 acetylase RimI-like enzyme
MGSFMSKKKIKLKDGRIAEVSFLSEKDDTRELLDFINALIEEKVHLLYERRFTLKQEEEWKKNELEKFRRKKGYTLVSQVDGKIAGNSGCTMGAYKEKRNALLGIAVAKEFRRLGLGEELLRLNIQTAKRLFRPRNIFLTVFSTNKAAYPLYEKLGFTEFAVFPKWLLHKGKYIDLIYMKL